MPYWSSPKTWTTGELMAASSLNTYVRDQQLALSTGELAEAAIGNLPGCKIGMVSDFTHNSSGNYLDLPCDAEGWDTDAMHDTATNNERIIAKTAGRYLVYGCALFGGGAGTYRALSIYFSSTAAAAPPAYVAPATSYVGLVVTEVFDMAVNDYVVLRAGQDSGGSITIYTGGTRFGAEFLSARPA
ncbi:MAG: hypothetical protein ABIH03_11690 [Pseudomonadota bacterium]